MNGRRASTTPRGGIDTSVSPSRSSLPLWFRVATKRALRRLSLLAGPLARRWARPGYFSASPPAESPRSVAVIACHWIGDTLWASQVVPLLQSAWPEAEITVITKPHAKDLWAGVVPCGRIVFAPEITSDRHRERVDWAGLARRAASLRPRRFDFVIDLTGVRYSALFTFLLRPGWAIGFSGGELGWLYSSAVEVEVPRRVAHLRERPFRIVARLIPGIAMPEHVRPPRPSSSFEDVCASLRLDPLKPVVVLAPGAGWPEKRWPEATFIEIAGHLAAAGAQIVTAGSSGESGLCERVRSGARGGLAVALIGSPLGDLCGLLSGAAAVIGHDSGPIHLAAAYGRRVLALLATGIDPALCRPIGDRAVVLHPSDARAHPAAIVRWALAAGDGSP